MPNNELKNRVRFSTTLDKNTEIKLKEFSKETFVPISKIVDKAIINYINSYQQK